MRHWRSEIAYCESRRDGKREVRQRRHERRGEPELEAIDEFAR